jgi:glycine cleavage system H protein
MTIKYSKDHEWINAADATTLPWSASRCTPRTPWVTWCSWTCPTVGTTFAQGDVAGVVESVKAAADVYMPVSGEVVEVNEALRADPSLANSDPLGAGWFFKVKLSEPAQLDGLMDETAYSSFSASA